MADKKSKEDENAVVLERVYNVPLRKAWLHAPKYKRAKKAITALREFMVKHMKSEDVKISGNVNLAMWKHGIKNPPHHIKVKAVKKKDDSVFVELDGVKLKEKVPLILKKARAKFEAATKKKKAAEKPEAKPKDEKAEAAKAVEKEEIKELKEESKSSKKEEHAPKVEAKEEKVQEHPNAPLDKKF